MHALSLHHLSVMDVPAAELVEIAAGLSCPHVCLFTFQPGDGVGIPLVRDEDVEPLRRRLRDAGVSVLGTTSFALMPDSDVAAYEAGVERSARLGARHANVRVIDDDEARATDNFCRFAGFCTERGLLPAIEPSGYGHVDAFPQALRMFAAAGSGILTLDPLHIIRTGTRWEAVEALDPALIGYVQICDGPLEAKAEDYFDEAAFARLPPGDGGFPLERLLGVTPPGMPLSIEVPCRRLREQGLAGRDLAAELVRRTRAWLGRQASSRTSSRA
jgi:sugar phosphate isomerase/epimerase